MKDAEDGAPIVDGAIDSLNPICTVAVLEALLPLRWLLIAKSGAGGCRNSESVAWGLRESPGVYVVGCRRARGSLSD